MTEPTQIVYDERPVSALYFEGEGAGRIKVGESGVTAIVAYEEFGEMAGVPWFAIYKGDKIKERWPARMCGVVYAD